GAPSGEKCVDVPGACGVRSPHGGGPNMRGRIGAAVAVVAVAGLSYLVTPASSKKAKPPLCTDGRYVVDGKVQLITGAAGGHPEMLVLEPPNVSLSSGCPATTANTKRMRSGTRVTADWSSCDGFPGKVHLKVKIDQSCGHVWGMFKPRKAKRKM